MLNSNKEPYLPPMSEFQRDEEATTSRTTAATTTTFVLSAEEAQG